MTLFQVLFLGHCVGDFLFQTAWMAKYKATRWGALLAHVAVYTATVTLFGWIAGGISWSAVALIFVTHALIDRPGLVQWWTKRIQGVSRPEHQWLLIVTDQIFHLLVLGLACILTQHPECIRFIK